MERLIKAHPVNGFQSIVSPGILQFLSFGRLRLPQGEAYRGETGSSEAVLDVFSGTGQVSVETPSGEKRVFKGVGGRGDVFSGPPVMVYLPPHSKFAISSTANLLDAGLFAAPADVPNSPALLEGASVAAVEVGRDNWRRRVYTALGENFPAQRLLAGETLNPPGNWSSYPPHKHDRSNPPQETRLEEVYFFRVKPAQGWGLIYTYTAPDDPEGFANVFVVEDGDTVLLPKGYHPVVAAPGYELHYTWVLAGEERRYGAWAEDPRHAWVKKK